MAGRHTGSVLKTLHPHRPQVRQAHPDLYPPTDSRELSFVPPR